jgi:short-subunit dehydrogenase
VCDVASSWNRDLDLGRGASAGIDGLINNAGCNEFAAFADTDLEPILSVNVVGTLRLTQALMAHLSTMPGALVVNVGSPFGSIGYPGYVAYCATKHALRGFSEALARENRDTGLTVVYVSPRATRTSMNSPLANAHNAALGVPMDPPEKAADFILKAIERRLPRSQRGLQESVQTWLNSLVPAVVDVALARQLHDIRKHFNSAGG